MTMQATPTTEEALSAEDVIRTLLGPEIEISYEPAFSLAQVDEQPLQIRAEHNLAPDKMVERYKVQMEYSVFPPIVVTADNVLADGHTRVKARQLREETTDRAFIVALRWHDADAETQAKIQLIGQVINQTAGQSLDKAETDNMIRNCLRLGFGYDQAAAFSGVSTNTIRAMEKVMAGEEKLRRLGLPDHARPATVARAVGIAADLHDEPFAELVSLTDQAGFRPAEVNELAKQVKAANTDREAVEIIKARREAEQERITRKAVSGNGHPPESQHAMMHLGWVNNPARDVASLVETRPTHQEKYLEAVTTAAGRLSDLAALQRAAMS